MNNFSIDTRGRHEIELVIKYSLIEYIPTVIKSVWAFQGRQKP